MTAEVAVVMLEEQGGKDTVKGSDHMLIRVSRASVLVDVDAPQSGYRQETVYTYPIPADLLDHDFAPCAVICIICGGRVELSGLKLYSDFSRFGLLLREDPQPPE